MVRPKWIDEYPNQMLAVAAIGFLVASGFCTMSKCSYELAILGVGGLLLILALRSAPPLRWLVSSRRVVVSAGAAAVIIAVLACTLNDLYHVVWGAGFSLSLSAWIGCLPLLLGIVSLVARTCLFRCRSIRWRVYLLIVVLALIQLAVSVLHLLLVSSRIGTRYAANPFPVSAYCVWLLLLLAPLIAMVDSVRSEGPRARRRTPPAQKKRWHGNMLSLFRKAFLRDLSSLPPVWTGVLGTAVAWSIVCYLPPYAVLSQLGVLGHLGPSITDQLLRLVFEPQCPPIVCLTLILGAMPVWAACRAQRRILTAPVAMVACWAWSALLVATLTHIALLVESIVSSWLQYISVTGRSSEVVYCVNESCYPSLDDQVVVIGIFAWLVTGTVIGLATSHVRAKMLVARWGALIFLALGVSLSVVTTAALQFAGPESGYAAVAGILMSQLGMILMTTGFGMLLVLRRTSRRLPIAEVDPPSETAYDAEQRLIAIAKYVCGKYPLTAPKS